MTPLPTSTCDLLGHHIAYHRQGAGEVVLLVHGISTYSFIWRKIIPRLAANYDVIAVDLLGCGASSKQLDQPYSIKNHAHLLRQFLDCLGVAKFHFVGHDVGGGIGQVFAVSYPDRLHDLVLVNSVAYDYWPVQPIVAMRTPIIRQLAMATLDMGALRMIIRRGLYYKENLTPEFLEYFWAPMSSQKGRKAFLHFAASLDNQQLLEITDDLHRLEIPVLIVRGDADPYLSRSIAEKLADNIPGSKLVIIPTGSHFIQEDEPALLAREFTQFYSRHSDA